MSAEALYNAKNPYTATVVQAAPLNGDGSAKDTRHVVINLGDSGIEYVVGDSLGVIPKNNPKLVDQLIAQLGGDDAVMVSAPKSGENMSLRQLLSTHEISKVPKALLSVVAEKAEDAELKAAADDKALQKTWCEGRDLLDLLSYLPAGTLTSQEAADGLKPLMQRLYSIASSIHAHPGEVHLTVGVVTFDGTTEGRELEGVCSTYLGCRLAAGDPVEVFNHTSKNFRLPEDTGTDVIMIGPGTGIAPFRAFLEERQVTQASGKNWLFFGDQHEATDYLYAEEFAAMQESGLLNKVSLAFSRDQEHKVYVQHRMLEAAAEIWAWLEGGAHFYVCGDALRMAKDVDAALLTIIQEHGGLDEAGAKDYVKALKKSKRYQRDVYAV